MKFVGNVADVWQESNHIVVIADVPDTEADFRHGDLLELRRPDGTKLQKKGNLILFDPPAETPVCCGIHSIGEKRCPCWYSALAS